VGRGKHKLANPVQIVIVEARHVIGQRVRMHRDFGMGMAAEEASTLDADRLVTECSPFGGASDDADMVGHANALWHDRISAQRASIFSFRRCQKSGKSPGSKLPHVRLIETPPSANSAVPVVKLDASDAR
jgi:hypothetical protein